MPKRFQKDYARGFALRANTPQPNGYCGLNPIEENKVTRTAADTGSVAMLAAMRRALPNKRTPSGHPLRVRKLYLSSGSLDRAARDIGGWPPCRL